MSKLAPVAEPVKKRRYDATARQARSARHRTSILDAAEVHFTSRGYAETTVAQIAASAAVSVDTVYALVGPKPAVLMAVHDRLLAEGGDDVPAEDRNYVREIRAAATATEKIEVYAIALGRVLPRSAPLLAALREAATHDLECRSVADRISQRRAANMRLLAADLRETGELRDDLDDEMVAELIWSMNGPEYFNLYASLGHPPERYVRLLYDVWTRTLLSR